MKDTKEIMDEAITGELIKLVKKISGKKESTGSPSETVTTLIKHYGVKNVRADDVDATTLKKEVANATKEIHKILKSLDKAKSTNGLKIFDLGNKHIETRTSSDFVTIDAVFELSKEYRERGIDGDGLDSLAITAAWSDEVLPVLEEALDKVLGYKKTKGDHGSVRVKVENGKTVSTINVDMDHKWRDILLSAKVFCKNPV